jgi:hypothetical protein
MITIFIDACLILFNNGIFFNSNSFVSLLFLNYLLNNVFPMMDVLLGCLWVCIFNGRDMKISFWK